MSSQPPFSLTPELPEDAAAIEALLDRAFGPGREAKRSYAYRQFGPSVPALRLCARDAAGRLVGTIRYWPVAVRRGSRARPALLLGPLAVEPTLRGLGIGRALVRASLARAAAARHRLVLLVGDADYYSQFGFEPAAPRGFTMPLEAPHRLLVLALARGALGAGGTLEPVVAPVALTRPARSRTRAAAPQAAPGPGNP